MGIVLILAGLFSIVAAILNWEWYMTARKARFIVRIFGRTGARVFYVLLGLVFVVLGILQFLDVIHLQ